MRLWLFIGAKFFSVTLPFFVFLGIHSESIASFYGLLYSFIVYPAFEGLFWLKTGTLQESIASENEFLDRFKDHFFLRHALDIYAVLHVVFFPLSVYWLIAKDLDALTIVGGIGSLAVMIGTIGALTAHELIHHKTPLKRLLGALIYSMALCPQFLPSHLSGHHKIFGTPADWGTAPRYQSAYHFALHAMVIGYINTWKLNHREPAKLLANYRIKAIVAQWAVLASVVCSGGVRGLGIFLLLVFLGVFVIEMINYLSHYGLVRDPQPDGKLGPIKAHYSWEFNNVMTNWFFFNAGKHIHHHFHPNDNFLKLKLHRHPSLMLPYGFPHLLLIALIPPLYFSLMDKHLKQVHAALGC